MNGPEVWIQIGGHVFKRSGNNNAEVPNAWVGIETTGGELLQSTRTNDQGQYIFVKLKPGQYRLNARAVGMNLPQPRTITVPSSTGEYDLTLT